MKLTKWFKIHGEDREFLYLFGSSNKEDLKPFINQVKLQGDLYRITHRRGAYQIWDARV